jgi:hypothetical protein
VRAWAQQQWHDLHAIYMDLVVTECKTLDLLKPNHHFSAARGRLPRIGVGLPVADALAHPDCWRSSRAVAGNTEPVGAEERLTWSDGWRGLTLAT